MSVGLRMKYGSAMMIAANQAALQLREIPVLQATNMINCCHRKVRQIACSVNLSY
jgi:hypothetical protein